MNSQEKLEILNAWKKQVDAYRQIEHDLTPIFGCVADMPLYERISDLLTAYTESVAKLVGKLVGDEAEWLNWYLWDNNMGENALEAEDAKGRFFSIKTLENLLEVIENIPDHV